MAWQNLKVITFNFTIKKTWRKLTFDFRFKVSKLIIFYAILLETPSTQLSTVHVHTAHVCVCVIQRERERKLYMKLSGNRVLIHVNIILVDGLHDQLVTLRLHQRGDEGSQVQLWLEIKQQLIVYDLVSCLLWY